MMHLWRFRIILVDRGFQDANVGKIAIALRIIKAITNNKAIGNLKALVVQFDNFDTLSPFIQQCTDTQAHWVALPQHIHLVVQSKATIDNILDNQHVLLVNRSL